MYLFHIKQKSIVVNYKSYCSTLQRCQLNNVIIYYLHLYVKAEMCFTTAHITTNAWFSDWKEGGFIKEPLRLISYSLWTQFPNGKKQLRGNAAYPPPLMGTFMMQYISQTASTYNKNPTPTQQACNHLQTCIFLVQLESDMPCKVTPVKIFLKQCKEITLSYTKW